MNTTAPTRSVFAFFGPPGSGKGTQSDKLQACYQSKNIRIVTMGAGIALRGLQTQQPDSLLAQMARNATSRGVSVAGALVTHYWVEPLMSVAADESFAYLVDGPCRVNHESQLFVEFIKSLDAQLYVIEFVLEDELCVERMVQRAAIENRADDADPVIMQRRLDTYRENTTIALESLVNYMTEVSPDSSHHIKLDGRKSIPEVYADMMSAIGLSE